MIICNNNCFYTSFNGFIITYDQVLETEKNNKHGK